MLLRQGSSSLSFRISALHRIWHTFDETRNPLLNRSDNVRVSIAYVVALPRI